MSANEHTIPMSEALNKIETLTTELAKVRKENEDLVLENTSLRLAIEDMSTLRRENARLRGHIEGILSGIKSTLGTPNRG